jgi:hypothetical protein
MKDLKIEIAITEQMIEDQIVTALEGGSNYWYYLGDTSMIPNYDKKEPLATQLSRAVLNEGIVIPVHDIEDEELLGNLSLESIQKGLTLMAKDYPEHFQNMITENGDAETADVFFQLAVMGELVFG